MRKRVTFLTLELSERPSSAQITVPGARMSTGRLLTLYSTSVIVPPPPKKKTSGSQPRRDAASRASSTHHALLVAGHTLDDRLRLLVPEEDVPAVGARHHILAHRTIKVDALDCRTHNQSGVIKRSHFESSTANSDIVTACWTSILVKF